MRAIKVVAPGHADLLPDDGANGHLERVPRSGNANAGKSANERAYR